ncbi:MAG: CPBP family glutamic-type intramembrane protease, partial [Actinomycetota bacterium]|nr:CPBP family glutamic-type intramembrane protease [Actinomycetota bacterium]
VMVAGFAAQATAWWFIASRRRGVWRVMTPILAAMGFAALLVHRPAWTPRVDVAATVGVGIATGLALYGATRVFVGVVRSWETFRRHSIAMYAQQEGVPLAAALALSLVLSVPGEELFWRGLFQPELAEALDAAALGALIAWAAYVAANLPSRNFAIVAGAVVGGAVWSGLGWWSGGPLAPLVSHLAWTGLMISFPVIRPSEVRA